jgi:murein DD-endopeptidase MepM/ murein hydrolase activator NlpD
VGADGKARYFDAKGKLLGDTFLRYPVKFSRVSSSFSDARLHPVLKRRIPHNGVDFAAPVGTPVRASADGTVTFVGRKGPSGIMIKVKHNARYRTAYLHLSRIAKGIKRGTRVSRGQVIGAVGATGRVTGPHLHYSFYDRGKYVDPMKIELPTIEGLNKGNRIAKSYLKRVVVTLERYERLQGNVNAGWQSDV